MRKKIVKHVCLLTLLSTLLLLFPGRAHAQNTRVTLNMENASMRSVMAAIEGQTRYLFGADNNLDLSTPVTVKVTNQPVTVALDQMLAGTGISYEINGDNILLSKKAPSKPRAISGKVLDASGEPIPGVGVYVKGTTTGTTTDLDGNFSLTVPGDQLGGQLEFNSLGYQTQSYALGSRSVFNVTMAEESMQLEGTVVTALGIRRDQKALSYNVQEVKSDLLTDVKDANFVNSLAGKVAGVTINASSSGVGGASKVVLRGNKSISQTSNALYVIDGIPMYNFGGGGGTEFDSKGATEAIADINPEDIESISVLTGAAAAALYGSEAANGAVMITTRKGQAGALKATFSSNTEFLHPFVMPEFQNRYGTGLNGKLSGSSIYSWGSALGNASFGYDPKSDYFETGHTYTNAVTLSGGTDKNQTYFSAAAVNSDGIVPNNVYDRYNFTFRNTSYFLHDKLRLDASASYIIQKDQNMTNQGVYANPLTSAYLFPRGEDFALYKSFERYNAGTKLMEQFWGDDMVGDLRMQNPYWINYRNLRNNDKKRYMLSFLASYDVLDWLNITGRVRIDNSSNLYTQKYYASTESTISEGGENGHYTEVRTYDKQTYADLMANIKKDFGEDWNLVANAGMSINNIGTDELSYGGPIQASGLANVFNVMDLDQTKARATKSGWNDETQSIFASVELGWRKMLYLTLTGRRDWASQLAGSSQKSFFYPSIGVSWIPTALWEIPYVDYLKLRASIASVGMPFPRFLTIPTYEYDATNRVWSDKTHYPIGDLKPERTKTYELGVDARFLKDFSLAASWYLADTYNQTFDPSLPPSSSYTTIYLQTGSVRNTGVELSLGYNHRWRDFGWESNFTWSYNKNKILDLADNAINPVTGEDLGLTQLEITGLGKVKYILKKGGTLGDIYTNSSLIYDERGYIKVDNDGYVSVTDSGDDVYLGSVFPKYNLAWRNSLDYKNLHFGILFSGRIGGVCYSATQAYLDLYGVSEASAKARDEGGVLINGNQRVNAQYWYQVVGSQSGLPELYTYSATNFRLQELSIGYTLQRKHLRNIADITFSLVGHNLWMIYCHAPFDPEAVATTGNNYQGIDYFMMPSLKSFGFNIKANF